MFVYRPGRLYVRETACKVDHDYADVHAMELQFETELFRPDQILSSVASTVTGKWYTTPRMGSYVECMNTALGMTGNGNIICRRLATDEDLHLMIQAWDYAPKDFLSWLEGNWGHLLHRGLLSTECARLRQIGWEIKYNASEA